MSILLPKRRMGIPSPAASWKTAVKSLGSAFFFFSPQKISIRTDCAFLPITSKNVWQIKSYIVTSIHVKNKELQRASWVKGQTWTLVSQGFTALKLSSTVTSYISTTPSALRKNCLVMLRNLRQRQSLTVTTGVAKVWDISIIFFFIIIRYKNYCVRKLANPSSVLG